MTTSWKDVKLVSGLFLVKGRISYGDKIQLSFAYSKSLVKLCKSFENRQWQPADKVWAFKDTHRNNFILDRMLGKDPLAQWDLPLTSEDLPKQHRDGSVWANQKEMYAHCLTYKQVILASEMGLGKTRVAVMLISNLYEKGVIHTANDVWYCSTKNGIVAVELELDKWGCKAPITTFTYNRLVDFLHEYTGVPPRVVIFDESSKLKTHTAQRAKAAKHLTSAMFDVYGKDCYVIEMTGTAAPKDAVDWWMQTEIAAPGFLAEATAGALRRTLCLIEKRESAMGGTYPHLLAWLDDEAKCGKCGELHLGEFTDHTFVPSVNEVYRLSKRLKGLVLVQFKRDCLDLPDKTLRVIQVKPATETVRAAKLIQTGSDTVLQKLIKLRFLSDGFYKEDEVVGEKTCPSCEGDGFFDRPSESVKCTCGETVYSEDGVCVCGRICVYPIERITCGMCSGSKKVDNLVTTTKHLRTSKDALLVHLLASYEEVGRFVVWCGFTDSIDKVTDICLSEGWIVLRIDGRGLYGYDSNMDTRQISEGVKYGAGFTNKECVTTLLHAMDYSYRDRDKLLRVLGKVVVVSQPRAGGMAYTFTAASADFSYSNDFDGEAKMQSAERIHRGGMSKDRECTNFEVVHLLTDFKILQSVKAKRDMQSMTLGELDEFELPGNLEKFDGNIIL